MFVPIERTVTFDGARQICEMVGRHVMKEHPREITMEWATEKRTGKIFIDHNMNVRGKTLNVAYSPRGVAGAPVSMPLDLGGARSRRTARFTGSEMCWSAWKNSATGGMMYSRRNRVLRRLSEVRRSNARRKKMAWPRAPSVP